MNIQWDAEAYDNDFSFVYQYGRSLLDLIDGENQSILDLGCGSGALTNALASRGHRAEGMDASGELLCAARANYPDLHFTQGDAVCFRVETPYDAVFSNAVFHWIERERQPALIACVFDALKPGGQFVFEFGGYGNNARIHRALQSAFEARNRTYIMPFYFPKIGEYTSLLEQGGFLVKSALLLDRPTKLKGRDGLRDWIRMFVKTPFAGIPQELGEEIIRSAAEELKDDLYKDGAWYADYVRLRGKAVKPPLSEGTFS
ncbi:MAG: class I SAM-dependent methyltransferase [Oscillibacter sp.]|nr:class I SAM-dependent methyltransferase [Oscillibacter sp.]